MDIRENILIRSEQLFLKYGVKSVTMDEIADKLGISKKTIYTHFKNKTVLVEATTMSFFDMIVHGIDGICEIGKNPIDELFAIKNYTHENLKDESCSSHYQLQKYYPSIFQSLKIRQLELMKTCVKDNLERGIEQGLYRSTIDVNFISRIYFTGVVGIKDEEIFIAQFFSLLFKSFGGMPGGIIQDDDSWFLAPFDKVFNTLNHKFSIDHLPLFCSVWKYLLGLRIK